MTSIQSTARLAELNKLAEDPNLWNDPQKAQKLMQERTSLEDALDGIGKVERELEDNVGMIELGEAENDAGVVAEAETALKNLKKEVARRELEALLSGEADRFDSYLEVHAGAGGTESQDWAEMLLRMYTRWAEKHGFKVEYLEETQGEEAGIKSATIQISRPQRLWLAEDRGRRAPAGADIAVQFQRAPAHLVLQRRGVSGGRRQHQDRHQGSPTCAPTPCAPAAPAASTSTRPNPRCG